MVEESETSDSWGSLLINGILSKLSLVSEKKSENHTGDQDRHLKMTKDASKAVSYTHLTLPTNPRV